MSSNWERLQPLLGILGGAEGPLEPTDLGPDSATPAGSATEVEARGGTVSAGSRRAGCAGWSSTSTADRR